MISNEHPEHFERYRWDPDLPRRVELGRAWMAGAGELRVTSAAGTDLTIGLAGAFVAGSTGVTDGPGVDRALAGRPRRCVPGGGSVSGRSCSRPAI